MESPQKTLTWSTLSAQRREDLLSSLRGGGSFLEDVIKAIEVDMIQSSSLNFSTCIAEVFVHKVLQGGISASWTLYQTSARSKSSNLEVLPISYFMRFPSSLVGRSLHSGCMRNFGTLSDCCCQRNTSILTYASDISTGSTQILQVLQSTMVTRSL